VKRISEIQRAHRTLRQSLARVPDYPALSKATSSDFSVTTIQRLSASTKPVPVQPDSLGSCSGDFAILRPVSLRILRDVGKSVQPLALTQINARRSLSVAPLGSPLGSKPRLRAGGWHMSKPISIIVPAHNEAMVIGLCLQSLLDQTPPRPLRIIVVANGCTDATADIVRCFQLAARAFRPSS